MFHSLKRQFKQKAYLSEIWPLISHKKRGSLSTFDFLLIGLNPRAAGTYWAAYTLLQIDFNNLPNIQYAHIFTFKKFWDIY